MISAISTASSHLAKHRRSVEAPRKSTERPRASRRERRGWDAILCAVLCLWWSVLLLSALKAYGSPEEHHSSFCCVFDMRQVQDDRLTGLCSTITFQVLVFIKRFAVHVALQTNGLT